MGDDHRAQCELVKKDRIIMVAKLKFQREESSVNKETTGRKQNIIDTCDELCKRKNVISNFCWTVKVSLLFFRETEASCGRKGQKI